MLRCRTSSPVRRLCRNCSKAGCAATPSPKPCGGCSTTPSGGPRCGRRCDRSRLILARPALRRAPPATSSCSCPGGRLPGLSPQGKMGAVVCMYRRGLAMGAAAGALVSWGGLLLLPQASAAAQTAPVPFVDIEGTRLTGVDDAGRKQGEMQAAALQIDRDRDALALTDVTGWL